MADVGADLGGACCAIINFSWFYNSASTAVVLAPC